MRKQDVELLQKPESPKQPQGHNNNKFSFLKTFTFSDVSTLHNLDHLDPNIHKSVYGFVSLLDVLTKLVIACYAPNLICSTNMEQLHKLGII